MVQNRRESQDGEEGAPRRTGRLTTSTNEQQAGQCGGAWGRSDAGNQPILTPRASCDGVIMPFFCARVHTALDTSLDPNARSMEWRQRRGISVTGSNHSVGDLCLSDTLGL